ncbi:uncharacterized protein B0H18DRAFT_1113180 [Fomitopsis serialis]|uniref:uncharacterized protein n=1 Tax=Fomitopsis serialis TaxID=139415 RepID=UPI0020079CDE|nr:uncharacterized protein B0H18DRAFT_1113180 [Neoantrodia serialis]KAH9937326.1 hypothetical protein B0H18DRAFT_1113180 [Neoantrodia serialis]
MNPPYMYYSATYDEPPLSPSSSISVQATGAGPVNDSPVTMSRPAVAHIRRRSSRIEAWLSEQHRIVHTTTDDDLAPTRTKPLPYLAYSQSSGVPLMRHELDDRLTADSYVVANDAFRLSRNASAASARSPDVTPRPSPPSTPRKGSPLHSGQRRFPSPSPLRNFHISFGARRPSISSEISANQGSAPSSASARTRGDSSAARTYTSGLSTSYAPSWSERTDPQPTEQASSWLKSPPTWRFKRPPVMEPVATVAEGPNDEPRSRPSLSSTATRSSATSNGGRTSLETPSTPRKLPFGSARIQSPSVLTVSSPSLWSLPTDASHMNDPPDSEKVLARDRDKSNSIRIPLSLKIPSANTPSFGSMSAAIASPRHKPVKKWCESFGEVNSISRELNGNLYVDFRKAEVADTVCRLQARVYIKGVGSVCLSYFTGKKP